jgi:hypothetical protein
MSSKITKHILVSFAKYIFEMIDLNVFMEIIILYDYFLFYLFETGFCCSARTDSELLGSRDPPASTSRVAEPTGSHHWSWLFFFFLYLNYSL